MEYNRPVPDARLLRAARSLHYNRAALATAAERSERAQEAIRSWLLLSGHAQAMLGMFHVVLEDDQLLITKASSPDASQLPLPGEDDPAYAQPRSASAAPLRAAEAAPAPLAEHVAGLSESELATLARGILSVLSEAQMAPLLARHEAGIIIRTPRDAAELLTPQMATLSQEQLRVVTLSTRHGVLGNHLVYQGTVSGIQVRQAEIFRPALLQQATNIVVAHNHPSGDPTPSRDDFALTRALASTAQMLDIGLLDHLVIASSGFYSFREHGHIPQDMPR